MAFTKAQVQEAVALILENDKGKRKFNQSVDLAINFKDIDFKKAENRLNVNVVLPHAPTTAKICVFADGPLAHEARNAGAELVLGSADIPGYAGDKKKQKTLLEYRFLAAPQLMAVVGKNLGQLLGTRGLLPKPVPPGANLKDLIDKARRSINLKTKGKYLPCVHCRVGNEGMNAEDLAENVSTVLEAISQKVADRQIKSVFVKTTMGAPVKIGALASREKKEEVKEEAKEESKEELKEEVKDSGALNADQTTKD